MHLNGALNLTFFTEFCPAWINAHGEYPGSRATDRLSLKAQVDGKTGFYANNVDTSSSVVT